MAQRPRHEFSQVRQLQRFEEVVEGPKFHGFDGCISRPVTSNKNDRDLGIALMDAAEDVETGEVGQRQIQQHDIGVVLGDHGQPFRRRGRRQHRDVRLLKAPSEGMEDGAHHQSRARPAWYNLQESGGAR